jgi:hypothetical protein
MLSAPKSRSRAFSITAWLEIKQPLIDLPDARLALNKRFPCRELRTTALIRRSSPRASFFLLQAGARSPYWDHPCLLAFHVANSPDPTFAVEEGVTSAKGGHRLMELNDRKLSTSVLSPARHCEQLERTKVCVQAYVSPSGVLSVLHRAQVAC